MSELDTNFFIFILMAMLIGSAVRILWAWMRLEVYIPLPYTVILFLIGFLWAVIKESYDLERFGGAMNSFTEMDPHLFLLIFLPPLLFESGLNINVHVFSRLSGQAFLLAGPGVLITMFCAAAFIKAIFPFGWSWGLCFVFGAMAAATDPVAVVALLGELGAPESLGTLIEGESLFNDGSAFVAFLVVIDAIKTQSLTGEDVVIAFCRLALGGALLGIVVGKVATAIIKVNYNVGDQTVEMALLLVTPYLVFYLCEAKIIPYSPSLKSKPKPAHFWQATELKLSGVLGVVCLTIYMKAAAHFHIYDMHAVHAFWSFLSWVCNTCVFLIVGGMVGELVWTYWDYDDTLYLFILYFGLMIIRMFTLAVLYYPLKNMGYGFTWQTAAVLTWGALRGAIGLAMGAIVLAEESIPKAHRDKSFLYISGIVAMTLLVNGSTMGYVLNLLGFIDRTTARKILATNAVSDLKQVACSEIKRVQRCRTFDDADWVHVTQKLNLAGLEHLFIDEEKKTMGSHEKALKAAMRSPSILGAEVTEVIEDPAARFKEAQSHGALRRIKSEERIKMSSPTRISNDGDEDVDAFTHTEVTDDDAYLQLREQYLHAFVAQVEHFRHEGELSGSSAMILLESAETALDPDCTISLADWWSEVVRPLCSHKMDGHSVKTWISDNMGCRYASEHFHLTGAKRAIECSKSFIFIAHTVRKRVLTSAHDSSLTELTAKINNEVAASIKSSAEYVAHLIHGEGNEHIARQVDTRRALGHVLKTLVNEVGHMWHDGKLHTDEQVELTKALHELGRDVTSEYTTYSLKQNQVDVLQHSVLFSGLTERELDGFVSRAHTILTRKGEDLEESCHQTGLLGGQINQVDGRHILFILNGRVRVSLNGNDVYVNGGHGSVIGAARAYIVSGETFNYTVECLTDVEALVVSHRDVMWLGQLDASTDTELWHYAATEAASLFPDICRANVMDDIKEHRSEIVHIAEENIIKETPRGGILLAGEITFTEDGEVKTLSGLSQLPRGTWAASSGSVICEIVEPSAQIGSTSVRASARHKEAISNLSRWRADASPGGTPLPSPMMSGASGVVPTIVDQLVSVPSNLLGFAMCASPRDSGELPPMHAMTQDAAPSLSPSRMEPLELEETLAYQ